MTTQLEITSTSEGRNGKNLQQHRSIISQKSLCTICLRGGGTNRRKPSEVLMSLMSSDQAKHQTATLTLHTVNRA